MRQRGFEVAKGFEEASVNLPKRSTKNAAGYDFEAIEDVTIEPFIRNIVQYLRGKLLGADELEVQHSLTPTFVKTGVKAYMESDEGLFLYNRSGNPLKRFLLLGNGVGVIDSDYYNNPDNDGHIMFQFLNFGLLPVEIKKGERIGQGIFKKFMLADGDRASGERTGGHGSTGA